MLWAGVIELCCGRVAEEAVKTARKDGAASGARPLPDRDMCLELLETMALFRRFEEVAGRE